MKLNNDSKTRFLFQFLRTLCELKNILFEKCRSKGPLWVLCCSRDWCAQVYRTISYIRWIVPKRLRQKQKRQWVVSFRIDMKFISILSPVNFQILAARVSYPDIWYRPKSSALFILTTCYLEFRVALFFFAEVFFPASNYLVKPFIDILVIISEEYCFLKCQGCFESFLGQDYVSYGISDVAASVIHLTVPNSDRVSKIWLLRGLRVLKTSPLLKNQYWLCMNYYALGTSPYSAKFSKTNEKSTKSLVFRFISVLVLSIKGFQKLMIAREMQLHVWFSHI